MIYTTFVPPGASLDVRHTMPTKKRSLTVLSRHGLCSYGMHSTQCTTRTSKPGDALGKVGPHSVRKTSSIYNTSYDGKHAPTQTVCSLNTLSGRTPTRTPYMHGRARADLPSATGVWCVPDHVHAIRSLALSGFRQLFSGACRRRTPRGRIGSEGRVRKRFGQTPLQPPSDRDGSSAFADSMRRDDENAYEQR